MTRVLQSTLEASGFEWPASRDHIPCMGHVIQLAVGAFIGSLGVKCRTKSWEAHERDQQFGENESIDIGKSQIPRKEGNARIYKVSAMRPGLAKIIEKVRISWYFEMPETDLHIAENACGIDYADTWSLNRVHWLSKCEVPHCITCDSGCEDILEPDTQVARAGILITGIHTRVPPKSNIHWSPATFHNSRWMDHCEVCHGNHKATLKLNCVDVEEAYRHIASRFHSV